MNDLRNNDIAVFDLDGTITKKDTYIEFIKFFRGNFAYYYGIFILSKYIFLFYMKIYSNDKLKEKFFTYFFKGFRASDVEKKGIEFSENVLPSLCFSSAINILNWHKEKKHDILILTASSDIWLEHWCTKNGFRLICTKFEKIDNVFTGKINGLNCFGIQKKVLLEEFLKNNNYTSSFGYGDSLSDKYFLELVNHPYLMALNDENSIKYWRP